MKHTWYHVVTKNVTSLKNITYFKFFKIAAIHIKLEELLNTVLFAAQFHILLIHLMSSLCIYNVETITMKKTTLHEKL